MLTAGKRGQVSLKYEKWEVTLRGNETSSPPPPPQTAAWRPCQPPQAPTSPSGQWGGAAQGLRAQEGSGRSHSCTFGGAHTAWGSAGPSCKLPLGRKRGLRGHFPTGTLTATGEGTTGGEWPEALPWWLGGGQHPGQAPAKVWTPAPCAWPGKASGRPWKARAPRWVGS